MPNTTNRRARGTRQQDRVPTQFERLQHATPLELVNESLRKERVDRNRRQAAWLTQVRSQMEAVLKELHFDSDAWRGLWIDEVVWGQYDNDPFERVTLWSGARPPANLQRLLDRLHARIGLTEAEKDRAFWAAAAAWCADDALQLHGDAAHQLLVGQYLAVCRANLLFPGRVTRHYGLKAKQGREDSDREKDRGDLRRYIRAEGDKLRQGGMSTNSAAKHLTQNNCIQQRAVRLMNRPYTQRGIRAILEREVVTLL